MGKQQHVLVVPYPAQGHVIPLMEVAHCLANKGFRVTFVNTEFNHERVLKAFPETGKIHEFINMVSVPDGCESMEERNDLGKLAQAISRVMPGELQLLIEKFNRTECDQVVCIIADYYMGWALEVARKLGIKKASFSPASVAMCASTLSAQKMIDDGILDSDGIPIKDQEIQLAPSMPKMSTMYLPWCLPDLDLTRVVFQYILQNNDFAKLAQKLICNTSSELEPAALAFLPDFLSIGPLVASSRLGKSSGHFWPEDSTCLDWLNQQSPNSVIYVAFGSFTIFNESQFHELALGLENTNKPFLWVVRRDMVENTEHSYPDGFKERVKDRARIVGWAPQQEVLTHPSVACFVSHCGWNSTTEGVSNGVPFICWPYFADQFIDQSYICDHWEIGLGLSRDEDGIIKEQEIKTKIEQLLNDDGYRKRSLNLKNKIMAGVTEGGCSQKNFDKFIDWIKEI